MSTIMALGLGTAATPASADDFPPGFHFYAGDWNDPASWKTPVLSYPTAPYKCALVPPTAEWHVGATVEMSFLFYLDSTDCTGPAHMMDTLRSYEAGTYKSFITAPDPR